MRVCVPFFFFFFPLSLYNGLSHREEHWNRLDFIAIASCIPFFDIKTIGFITSVIIYYCSLMDYSKNWAGIRAWEVERRVEDTVLGCCHNTLLSEKNRKILISFWNPIMEHSL